MQLNKLKSKRKYWIVLKLLYDKGLASQEEYEIAKGTYDLYLINSLDISKAQIKIC
jgi:hypothetical protein